MTHEIPIKDKQLTCTDGVKRDIMYCRMCRHSRYFIVDGKQERSPALAFCLRERVDKPVSLEKATAVGCVESAGDGFSSVTNIIS